MSYLINGSIDVSKIIKEKLVKGKKGIYVNVSIWVNDEPDKYGNHASIQQSQTKEERDANEEKNYLGNGKIVSGQAPGEGDSKVTEQDKEDLPF